MSKLLTIKSERKSNQESGVPYWQKLLREEKVGELKVLFLVKWNLSPENKTR